MIIVIFNNINTLFMNRLASRLLFVPVLFICLCGCRKRHQDVTDTIQGEWECSGTNHVYVLRYDPNTNKYSPLDTNIDLTNYIVKIFRINDSAMRVECKGYSEGMSFGEMGGVLYKSTNSLEPVEFEDEHVNSQFGYGSRKRLQYFVKGDKIVYRSSYFSGHDSYVDVSGRRK